MCRAPMMTQSVGVPRTAKWRGPTSRSRSGSFSDSECETPDWSSSGATSQTSSDSARAISSITLRPGAWIPSSLVQRIRMPPDLFREMKPFRPSYPQETTEANTRNPDVSRTPLRLRRHRLQPAHIGLQHVRHRDRAILLLIGLHHGDQRAANRSAGAVQRMHEMRLAVAAAIARIHAPGLEVAADRAARDLAEGPAVTLPGHPNLNVVGLLRGETHVARA